VRALRSTPLLVGAAFVAGLTIGGAASSATADPYADLDRLARVLSLVEQHYVEPVGTGELVDHALRGMVSSLDPHSRWLDDQEYRSFLQDNAGQYEGIGVEVREHADGVVVVRVLPGGPAARDGLTAGDRITAVNGASIAGSSLSDVSGLLRGERGSAVTLSVLRGRADERVTVETVRDRIDVEVVEAGPVDGDIAYVRLSGFPEGAADEVRAAARRLLDAGHGAGLILDLRDNPGGLLDEAVALADLFLEDGTIVTVRGRVEGEEVHAATRGGLRADLPVVVLVDGGSASASEVVAGALQDTGRAVLVGTRTFGKGTVQTVMSTRHGGALKLTIARYYTPSGAPVTTDRGRSPDRLVEGPNDEEGDAPWHAPLTDRERSDLQLRAAIEEIRRARPADQRGGTTGK
jgi:carboxyl-terminal processing protease